MNGPSAELDQKRNTGHSRPVPSGGHAFAEKIFDA